METSAIVEVDVVSDRASGLMGIRPRAIGQRFRFECTEKAFDGRVVPAIGGAAHTRPEAVACEERPILVACVLGAAIGVMQDSRAPR